MRNRVTIALSRADRTIVYRWSAGTTAIAAALAAAVLVLPVFKGNADTGGGVRRADDTVCASLDRLARNVIAALAQQPDPDVAEISDMIAHMQRGRRTCEIGWPQLACREYQVILERSQGHSGDASQSLMGCLGTSLAGK